MVREIDGKLVMNGSCGEVKFKSCVKGEGNVYGEGMGGKFGMGGCRDGKGGVE